jgi:hypothetical protein
MRAAVALLVRSWLRVKALGDPEGGAMIHTRGETIAQMVEQHLICRISLGGANAEKLSLSSGRKSKST